jgi:anti-sigma B factor antagonist
VSVSSGADGTLDVVLRGEIDYTNAAGIVEAVRAAVETGRPSSVRVEMAEVTFLDSSGIGVLVHAMKAAEEVRAAYRVDNPNPKVFDQLRMVGLLEAFGLSDSVPEN